MLRSSAPGEAQAGRQPDPLYERQDRHEPLCLSTSRSPTADLEFELQIAGEAGFAWVELWAPSIEAYLAHRPLIWLDMQMRQHGLFGLVVNGIDLPPAIHGARDEDALVAQARFLELCTHLDALGGGTIVLHPAAEQEDREKRAEGDARVLRTYADLAAPFEVVLALEFRADSSVPDLAAAQVLVQGAARSNLRLALSTRECCARGSDPRSAGTIQPGMLALVHLDNLPDELDRAGSGAGPRPEGEKPDPVRAARAAWAAAGFRGPYCVPLAPGPGTPLERARAARQAALRALQPDAQAG